MINWKQTDFGLKFEFISPVTIAETENWRDDVFDIVPGFGGKFSVLVDMREIDLIPSECKNIIEEVQIYCKQNGLERSALILAEELTAKQLKVIANRTGIREWERYIIAAKATTDPERIAQAWVEHAVEPDKAVQQPVQPAV